ncbi:MAG TPA: hypothetical protein VJJ46_13055 [Anaerolineales bacterium]|nr:hypothetical protein [Anaerolineales bacterium]
MIRRMVLYLLGPLGREVLEFYIAHSAVINGIVVIYALVLLLARRNLQRIEARAVEELKARVPFEQAAALTGLPAGFSWTDIIRQSSFFPFVAGPNHWFPRLSRPGEIDRMSPLPRLLERIQGAAPPDAS